MTPRRDGATAQTPSGEPLGTLAVALQHTHRLPQRDPRLAEQQCREILKVLPDTAKAHHLLGSALAAQQRHGEAIASLRLATRLNGSDAEAWRELAGQLLLSGDDAGADAAHAEELLASALDPRLQTAARALIDNDIPLAEHMLREHLRETPNDSGALRMLAEVGGRLGRYDDALAMLEHALQIAPGFAAARFNRALRRGQVLAAFQPIVLIPGAFRKHRAEYFDVRRDRRLLAPQARGQALFEISGGGVK